MPSTTDESSQDANPRQSVEQSADYIDPVIAVYMKDVDRTLLRENLKLTVEERFLKHERAAR